MTDVWDRLDSVVMLPLPSGEQMPDDFAKPLRKHCPEEPKTYEKNSKNYQSLLNLRRTKELLNQGYEKQD
jgi:hypothetical protein